MEQAAATICGRVNPVAPSCGTTDSGARYINLGGSCEQDVLAEPVREDIHIGESRAAARSNRASSLWPASSSGASVGPTRVV
jgi:hypothetical protein